MSKLRVNSFSISIDGYSAGPNQSIETPLGTTWCYVPLLLNEGGHQ
jgi:hypothetical protein